MQFSANELIRGEPDASSFPSGGVRSTFEARGYTAWDPTSPAFIKKTESGGVLCIPSVFCSYHGEALDKKTPLLRSMAALSKQVCRLAQLFGIDIKEEHAFAELGVEQEYFLIDRDLYDQRLDLLQTGRTLFGRRPAKHQQMADHYFGAIKSRVMEFMDDLDRELWALGIPAKTRHNEVCPSQFEIASVYEELNLAVDHNMLVMEGLREVADRHGFACLLHEKPYAGVNGSGKHNNWSVMGPDGKSWLAPGDTPLDNARFLTMICALLKAVDENAELLRAAIASSGNDHRLGAHEAPPAIVSVFLGDELMDIIDRVDHSAAGNLRKSGVIEIGVSALPDLPRDATDRNRTSPLAFTGNKFEFRAVGASQTCASANIVLNTIVAEALSRISDDLEAAKKKSDFNKALQVVLKDVLHKHRRIVFNGDNYTEAWEKEAKKRGLPNIKTTPEALAALTSKSAIALLERHNVLSARELESRHRVYIREYEGITKIEAECAITIARTMILPAAVDYENYLAEAVSAVARAARDCKLTETKSLLKQVCSLTESLLKSVKKLEATVQSESPTKMIDAMGSVRKAVDALESLLPHDAWPLPTYAEMMFIL